MIILKQNLGGKIMKENTQYNTGDPRRYDPEFNEFYKGSEIPQNNQNGLFSNRINIKSDSNRLNETSQSPSKLDRDIDKIIDMLHSVNYEHDEAIREANHQGYRIGFNAGFQKADEIYNINCDFKDIDWESIQKFAKFCYIYGIDFSYMAKGTDTIPFTERVINKFKEEIEVKDK